MTIGEVNIMHNSNFVKLLVYKPLLHTKLIGYGYSHDTFEIIVDLYGEHKSDNEQCNSLDQVLR